MSRCLMLAAGSDLIAEVAGILERSGQPWEESLVIFPGKRPGHFLRRALAQALGRAYRPPRILSLDELAEDLAERSGFMAKKIDALEAAARLYPICGRGLPGGRPMPLERFLPWGFKIYSDLEELKMELVPAARLRDYDAMAGQRLPARWQHILRNLSQVYEDFYQALEDQRLATRALFYSRAAAAENICPGPLVVIAGIFGLTGAEEKIFRKYLDLSQTVVILQQGPGIEALVERLDLKPKRMGSEAPRPEIVYYPAPDGVGQAMALNQAIEGDGVAGRAVVLPQPETLFPVVDHVLGRFGEDWNVSLGYPLMRTPLLALIKSIARMLETAEGQRLYVPDYLSVLLHPYIKNLAGVVESRLTRIICQAVEERIAVAQLRFVSPAEIESDRTLAEAAARMAAAEGGLEAGAVSATLGALHRLTIYNFEAPQDIGSFAARVLELMAAIAEHSHAQQHPYAAKFFESAASAMEAIRRGSLASCKLESRSAYFRFLEAALSRSDVHYPGTPLKGLQVLGFLETRNLRFDEVFILDVNEGVLPPHRSAESLLPTALRSDLGLPDPGRAEAVIRYHFHNLIAGARRVHIFYRQGRGEERSRLVEELWWRQQQAAGSLEMVNVKPIHFAAAFGHSEPRPRPKSPQVLEILADKVFSASSLDTYLRCPLEFYYSEVLGLGPEDEVEAEPDRSQIGDLVHDILKNFFYKRRDRPLDITARDHQEMARLVEDCFRERFGDHLDGRLVLTKQQVAERMRYFLEWDQKRRPVIRRCEEKLNGILILRDGRRVAIKGRIDRVEECQGRVNIIDYKTGSSARLPQKSFSPEERERWSRSLGSVQLPLYGELYRQNFTRGSEEIDCGLMLLGKRAIEIAWLYQGRPGKAEDWWTGFLAAITGLIEEILDPGRPFVPTAEAKTACGRCDFQVMCDRQWLGF